MLLTMKYHPLVVFIEQEVCIQMIADKHTTFLLIMLDNPGHGDRNARYFRKYVKCVVHIQ
jgi:hypothetical protein